MIKKVNEKNKRKDRKRKAYPYYLSFYPESNSLFLAGILTFYFLYRLPNECISSDVMDIKIYGRFTAAGTV